VGNTKLFRELITEGVFFLFGILSNTEEKNSIVLWMGVNGRPPFFHGIPLLLSLEVFPPFFVAATPYF
jgi:hypothetical protein